MCAVVPITVGRFTQPLLQVDGGLLELLRTLWCADAAANRHIVNALGNCGYEIVTLQPKAAEVCTRVRPRALDESLHHSTRRRAVRAML